MKHSPETIIEEYLKRTRKKSDDIKGEISSFYIEHKENPELAIELEEKFRPIITEFIRQYSMSYPEPVREFSKGVVESAIETIDITNELLTFFQDHLALAWKNNEQSLPNSES